MLETRIDSLVKSNNAQKKYGFLYLFIALIALMLLMRDSYGISINKYIFVLLIGIVTFLLPIDKVICLISFLMPLYVGLPGNYLTLVFLLRFLFALSKINLNNLATLFSIATGFYVFIQGVITNHTAMAELVFLPGLILVMLMFSKDIKVDKTRVVIYYVFGVASLGLIMLISTLQEYDLSDLLDSTFRLGSVDPDIIRVSMDPNFYGMFVIAAISLACQFVLKKGATTTKAENILTILSLIAGIVVAFIGLSRSFILVLIVWALIYTFSKKNITAFVSTAVLICLIFFVLTVFMPDILDAIIERFSSSDFEGGNGRIEGIINGYKAWTENIFTIVFGYGLFNATVHCTPLQFVYGGGVVLTFLMTGFVFTLVTNRCECNKKVKFIDLLPAIVTVIMSLTVPAAMLTNFMYPIFITMLLCREI